ncbi:PilZ domain-containing protein [Nitrospira sp. CMX1]|nr:PilZ domain-containing protein [Nitrospira sp.]MBS0165829.1 PilZ domain-containing protein [Nitrospira sp.]
MATSDHDEKKALQSRRRPRVSVDYPASFTAEETSGHATVTNLTLAGGEIESNIQLPIGARLSLHVLPPSARPSIVIALAIVRWKEGNRYGLEFVRFEGDAKEQLKDMLNQ